jgi:phosphate transport system permease protein
MHNQTSPTATLDPVLANRLKRQPLAPRTLFNSGMTIVVCACALIVLVPLGAVLTYVIMQGSARFGPDLFTQLPPPPSVTGGGFGNAFVGTLKTVGIGSAIAIPFGVLAAIYLAEFAKGTRIASWIGFLTNVLSGVPSIVVGVFAYSVVVLNTGGFSAIAGGIALAILMLPIIVRTAVESLELVPAEARQAAVGLGATRFQMVSRVVLPAALPAILTGVILAVARASGETAPLIFTALFNQFWVDDLWKPTPTLSVLVFNFAITPYKNQQELAGAGSFVLVMMVLIASILSRLVVRRK